MRFAVITYDGQGRMLLPTEHEIAVAGVSPGLAPTQEEGFFHRVRLEAADERGLNALMDEFTHTVGSLPGYSTVTSRLYSVDFGGWSRKGIDAVYAIEKPRSRPSRGTEIATRR